MKIQILGLGIIVLIININCSIDQQKSQKNVSVDKKETKIIQKKQENTTLTTTVLPKNKITKYPVPSPSYDDLSGINLISPIAPIDDIVELREYDEMLDGTSLINPTNEGRYAIGYLHENNHLETKSNNIELFVDPEIEASFPGGMAAMNKFIKDNLIYPPLAIEMNLQGKCYLQFVVNIDGTLSNVKVMRGVYDCPECDKEAIRVVKAMPNWNPGKLESKVVRSYYTLPIIFKMI